MTKAFYDKQFYYGNGTSILFVLKRTRFEAKTAKISCPHMARVEAADNGNIDHSNYN